jgi:hypothetical protein
MNATNRSNRWCNPWLRQATVLAAVCAALLWCMPAAKAADQPCPYNAAARSFVGSPLEQASCLMRPVREWNHVDEPPVWLPRPIVELIGKPVNLPVSKFRAYLAALGLTDSQVGGPLSDPLVATATRVTARYFVIHDTSTCVGTFWPKDLDTVSSSFNRRIFDADLGRANTFVSRVGVVRGNGFGVRRTGTKFTNALHPDTNGLFLHVELYQPRMKRRPCEEKGGAEYAPVPGFTDQQYSQLALLYIAASMRKGEWLIPAFHAVIDLGIANGHDDPQNFSLDSWNNWLLRHLAGMHQVNAAK